MPHRALTITSTTNFHAIGNYIGVSILGAAYFVNPRVQALDDMLGQRWAALLMGTMFICGVMALIVSVTAKNRKDPSTSLAAESIILAILAFTLAFLISGVLIKYGVVVAMVSSVLLGAFLVGCAGRCIQAARELHKLNKIRKLPIEMVEVPAEPEQG